VATISCGVLIDTGSRKHSGGEEFYDQLDLEESWLNLSRLFNCSLWPNNELRQQHTFYSHCCGRLKRRIGNPVQELVNLAMSLVPSASQWGRWYFTFRSQKKFGILRLGGSWFEVSLAKSLKALSQTIAEHDGVHLPSQLYGRLKSGRSMFQASSGQQKGVETN
jgi:hypothetical protein